MSRSPSSPLVPPSQLYSFSQHALAVQPWSDVAADIMDVSAKYESFWRIKWDSDRNIPQKHKHRRAGLKEPGQLISNHTETWIWAQSHLLLEMTGPNCLHMYLMNCIFSFSRSTHWQDTAGRFYPLGFSWITLESSPAATIERSSSGTCAAKSVRDSWWLYVLLNSQCPWMRCKVGGAWKWCCIWVLLLALHRMLFVHFWVTN